MRKWDIIITNIGSPDCQKALEAGGEPMAMHPVTLTHPENGQQQQTWMVGIRVPVSPIAMPQLVPPKNIGGKR